MSELEWEFYKHQSYHAHFVAYCKYHIHFKTMTEFQLKSSKNRHAKFSSCILLLVIRIKFLCETQYCHGQFCHGRDSTDALVTALSRLLSAGVDSSNFLD